jgi:hypothetical protein
MRRPVLALLSLLATPADAQNPESLAELLTRAPALPLDAAAGPMTAPVQVGGAGWGPFRRLCVTNAMLLPDGAEVPRAPVHCMTIEASRAGALWRLEVTTEAQPRIPALRFSTTRDATGRVGAIVFPPDAAPPEPARAELAAVLRGALQAHGMEARRLAPGERFVQPLPLGVVPGLTIRLAQDGLACTAESLARIGGRPVLIAACEASGSAESAGVTVEPMRFAGRFAHDIETGLVLAHGYGTSMTLIGPRPDGGRQAVTMRAVSRQRLE